MSKTAKRLLVPALGCMIVGGAFNLGLVNAHNIDALYTILPLGAVFFGLFLIVLLMEKENALHEQDRHVNEPAAGTTDRH